MSQKHIFVHSFWSWKWLDIFNSVICGDSKCSLIGGWGASISKHRQLCFLKTSADICHSFIRRCHTYTMVGPPIELIVSPKSIWTLEIAVVLSSSKIMSVHRQEHWNASSSTNRNVTNANAYRVHLFLQSFKREESGWTTSTKLYHTSIVTENLNF